MLQTMLSVDETEVADSLVMNIMPVVSVCMITYNHSNYIAQAIEGVVTQKVDFPFELIIGEDCSTDNTRNIVLDYQRRYPHLIRVVYSGQNVGGIDNDARCFKKARGKFVAYCEGDDFWHEPLKLQKQVNFMHSHPNYGMVHSDYNYMLEIFGKSQIVANYNSFRRIRIPEGEIFFELLRGLFVRTCTIMVRRKDLRSYYASDLHSSALPVGDWPLVLYVAHTSKIGYLKDSLATYRRNSGSMTGGYEKQLDIRKKMIAFYAAVAKEFKLSAKERSNLQRQYYRGILLASVNAVNKDDFCIAYQWLAINDSVFLKKAKVLLFRFVMNWRLIALSYLWLKLVTLNARFLLNSQLRKKHFKE